MKRHLIIGTVYFLTILSIMSSGSGQSLINEKLRFYMAALEHQSIEQSAEAWPDDLYVEAWLYPSIHGISKNSSENFEEWLEYTPPHLRTNGSSILQDKLSQDQLEQVYFGSGETFLTIDNQRVLIQTATREREGVKEGLVFILGLDLNAE